MVYMRHIGMSLWETLHPTDRKSIFSVFWLPVMFTGSQLLLLFFHFCFLMQWNLPRLTGLYVTGGSGGEEAQVWKHKL